MFPKDIYIDLGTENTLIYAKNQGILLNHPTVMAHNLKNNCKTMGALAKKMLGKTPDHFSIYKPLEEGVIKDFEHAKEMLAAFLKNVQNEMLLTGSRILISLPRVVQKYESEMFRSLAYELGAGIVDLVSEPLAGAIGTGVNVLSRQSFTFVDLGAGTTEVITTYNGQVIRSEAARTGGNDIDLAIVEILKSQYNFSIGEQTAEFIKKEVAILDLNVFEEKSCLATGINLITGLPEKRSIDSSMIQAALFPTFKKITSLLNNTFNECPPDIIAEIIDNGIFLFGGTALIKDSTQYLSKIFGVPFHKANNPLMSVTIGGARILDNKPLFNDLKLNDQSYC